MFRGDMIRKRPFNVPKPMQRFLTSQSLKGGANKDFTMSFSEMTGHAAFLFSMCMFLETDIFNLRVFAIGSILSSVVFQYYREIPLLIPIRWNVLFVCINIGMLGLLLQEYHEAEYMPKEQKDIYRKYLSAEGMDKVDFMHLMQQAERKVVKPGEYLIRQGKMNYRVYYVAEGDVKVLRDQDVVSKLGANTFVAEMGFVKWREFETQRARKEEKEREEQRRRENRLGLRSLGDEVQRSLSYMGGTLSTPGVVDHMDSPSPSPSPSPNDAKQQQVAVVSEKRKEAAGSGAAGSTRTWAEWFEGMGVVVGVPSSTPDPQGADEDGVVVDAATGYRIDVKNAGIVASSDVKATKKCIVYSWRFSELEELMNNRTGAALVLERSFSNDLSRKMRKHDIKQKYKYVLLGISLSLGEATEGQPLDPAMATAVRKLRKEYGVSQRIHREVCDDLKLPLSVFDLPGDASEDEEEGEGEEDKKQRASSLLAAKPASQRQRQEGGRFTSLAEGKQSTEDEEGRGASGGAAA